MNDQTKLVFALEHIAHLHDLIEGNKWEKYLKSNLVALVSALDSRLVNGLIVRKEAKGHGTQAYIEGLLPPEGTKITVLEDVITTGGSAIKAATRLRDAGYVVERDVAIVDRQEDKEADEFMQSVDLELRSLFTLGDVINAKNE